VSAIQARDLSSFKSEGPKDVGDLRKMLKDSIFKRQGEL